MRPDLLQVVDSQSKHNQIGHHSLIGHFVRVHLYMHMRQMHLLKNIGDNKAASFLSLDQLLLRLV